MSSYVIPGTQAVAELRRTHERTFAIEATDAAPFLLHLKFPPTQVLSLINGAPLELVVGSALSQAATIAIRLGDVVGAYTWIERTFDPTAANAASTERCFPPACTSERMVTADRAQVALFDLNMRFVHTEVVPVFQPRQSLRVDFANRASHRDKTAARERSEEEHVLRFGPFVTRPTFFYTNLAFRDHVGNAPYLVSTNKYSTFFNTNGYLEEGRHGYYQEQFLAGELARLFPVGQNLFLSPRTRDETELTDFVLAVAGVVVLIESKASQPYGDAPRKARNVERSLIRLVRKAFEQLHRAQEMIAKDPCGLQDAALFEHCVHAHTIVCVCIVDDAYMINARALGSSLRDFKHPAAHSQPYILELEDFFGLLLRLQSIQHVTEQLLRLSHSIPIDAPVPLFHLRF